MLIKLRLGIIALNHTVAHLHASSLSTLHGCSTLRRNSTTLCIQILVQLTQAGSAAGIHLLTTTMRGNHHIHDLLLIGGIHDGSSARQKHQN